jgi:hypothetical protein
MKQEQKKQEQRKQVERKQKENNHRGKNQEELIVAENKQVENVVWIGTSVSYVLDKKKFQNDTKTNLKNVKAYGIKAEANQRYPELNFTKIVPKVVKNENPDAIVMQTGSIEIPNIDVKKALMDPSKSI